MVLYWKVLRAQSHAKCSAPESHAKETKLCNFFRLDRLKPLISPEQSPTSERCAAEARSATLRLHFYPFWLEFILAPACLCFASLRMLSMSALRGVGCQILMDHNCLTHLAARSRSRVATSRTTGDWMQPLTACLGTIEGWGRFVMQ